MCLDVRAHIHIHKKNTCNTHTLHTRNTCTYMLLMEEILHRFSYVSHSFKTRIKVYNKNLNPKPQTLNPKP